MSYQFYTLPQNTSEAVGIILNDIPIALSSLTIIPGSANDLVTLRANVGWHSGYVLAQVLFKIWRGDPVTGTLIYSAPDAGEAFHNNRKVTTLAHVDSGFTASGPVTYILTAEQTPFAIPRVNVIGPLTFTAVPVS